MIQQQLDHKQACSDVLIYDAIQSLTDRECEFLMSEPNAVVVLGPMTAQELYEEFRNCEVDCELHCQ